MGEDDLRPRPIPKLRRRGRLVSQIAVSVVFVVGLGAAYWFTRPPELVWRTGFEIGKTGRHFRMLAPLGWCLTAASQVQDSASVQYAWVPCDERPDFLRAILPQRLEEGQLRVSGFGYSGQNPDLPVPTYKSTVTSLDAGKFHCASRFLALRTPVIRMEIMYSRTDGHAFNATYKQICNSVRIE